MRFFYLSLTVPAFFILSCQTLSPEPAPSGQVTVAGAPDLLPDSASVFTETGPSGKALSRADSLEARLSFFLESQDTLSAVQTLTSVLDILSAELDSGTVDYSLIKSRISRYDSLLVSLDPSFSAAPDTLALPDDSDIENLTVNRAELERMLTGLDTTGTTIRLDINPIVEKHIAYFQTRGRDRFLTYLERAGTYFPVMLPILQEEGAPPELIYLTMVESGVNPLAKSRAKAVGIWQFIRGTGKLYDLRGNFWYDERRNIEKSTRASARHFRDLMDMFDDWHLALASYNSGAGRVKKAIRRAKGKRDFWEIRRFLPKETRNYVPAYIAATLIATNPAKFGFPPMKFNPDYQFDEAEVKGNVPLDMLAVLADTSTGFLQFLNPELTRLRTPPGKSSYTLRIPKGMKASFTEAYAAVPDSVFQSVLTHTTQPGETIQGICKEYGVTPAMLSAENPKLGKGKVLPAGLTLTIPVAEPEGGHMLYSDVAHYGQKAAGRGRGVEIPGKGTPVIYKVRKGDTLGAIAQRYGVKTSSLKTWNGISGSTIRAGQKLKIYKK